MLKAQAEELARMAVDLAPAGMLAVDAEGKLVLVNHEIERMFGYAREELLGASVEMLVPEAARAAHPGYRAGYLRTAQTRPMGKGQSLRGLRKDGSEVPVEIGLNPVELDGHRLVLASVVDISERVRAEEELQQRQRVEAIGALASGIAHDFNNILLGIVGYTELASEGTESKATLADLDEVLRASERGRNLVQRILDFSRRSDVRRSVLEPGPVVDEALALLRASLSKRVALHVQIEPEVPKVLSESGMLNQIVMNLVTNAAQAMPQGGQVEVSLAAWHLSSNHPPPVEGLQPGRYARLRVRDQGEGMSSAVMRRALEPYFTTKAPGEGTGLGLSIIDRMVRDHGGAVRLESKPGIGTTVDVFLPAHDRGEASDRPTEHRGHVLLVEDEVELSVMLRRQIERLGVLVTACTSSVDALEKFHEDPDDFDLLITDNNMPQLTGLELIERVHAQREDIPVMLISGLANTIDRDTIDALGIARVLAKPHGAAELRQAVRDLIPALGENAA